MFILSGRSWSFSQSPEAAEIINELNNSLSISNHGFSWGDVAGVERARRGIVHK